MSTDKQDTVTRSETEFVEKIKEKLTSGIIFDDNFQKTYLPMRKRARHWAGIEYPGLFDCDLGNDGGWFKLTVFMELTSLAITSFLLEERLNLSIIVFGAIVLFCLDFTFAYFHHLYKTNECHFKNLKMLLIPILRNEDYRTLKELDYTGTIDVLMKTDKARRWLRPIFASLIWLLSFIKCGLFLIAVVTSYWFQLAVSDSKLPFLIIIFVIGSYLWIARNHLSYTGYYLAYLWHKNQEGKTLILYRSNPTKQQSDDAIKMTSSIEFEKIATERNNYYKNKTGSQFYKNDRDLKMEIDAGISEYTGEGFGIYKPFGNNYKIFANGFLSDEQLDKLVKAQDGRHFAEYTISQYGHYLQMEKSSLLKFPESSNK